MALLWVWLGRRLPSLRVGDIGRSAARTLAASLVAGGAGYVVATWAAALGLARILPGLIGGVAFAFVFLVACWILKSPELGTVLTAVRRRRTA